MKLTTHFITILLQFHHLAMDWWQLSSFSHSVLSHFLLYECRRSYTEVLKKFFEEKLLSSQNLFSDAIKYETILEMIPEECMMSTWDYIWLLCFLWIVIMVTNAFPWVPELFVKYWTFAAITSELRGRWADSRSSKDVNVVRWEQLKHQLQSGKQKVDRLCDTFSQDIKGSLVSLELYK